MGNQCTCGQICISPGAEPGEILCTDPIEIVSEQIKDSENPQDQTPNSNEWGDEMDPWEMSDGEILQLKPYISTFEK